MNMKINRDLFFTFLRIGFFTFGGGLAMIPVIEEEIVNKKEYITKEEFVNIIAVVQSMPGVIAINMASVIGSKINGLSGALLCYFGVVLPSFTSIYLIARFFTPYMDNEYITAFFKGLKPAVVVLISISAFRMREFVFQSLLTKLIAVGAILLLILNVDPVFIIIASGITGVLVMRGKYDENDA